MNPEVWLKLWTEDGGTKNARYTGGYVGFVVASMILGSLDLGYGRSTHLHSHGIF